MGLLESLLQKMVADFKMNQEKLKQLQAQVRIGGKGTVRRKKKVVHRTATTDDKKLQSSLKKLSVNNIPGIEEVNMIKDDEVPDLVENFDEVSKNETATEDAKISEVTEET